MGDTLSYVTVSVLLIVQSLIMQQELDGTTQIFNATTDWLLGNTLLFFQDGLNLDGGHSLTAVNVDNVFALNSVQIMQFDPVESSAPSSLSSGST